MNCWKLFLHLHHHPAPANSFDSFFSPLNLSVSYSDPDFDLDVYRPLPPPPLPQPLRTTNRTTHAIISGLEIDLSELRLLDRDDDFPNPPRPPPPPPLPPPLPRPILSRINDLPDLYRDFSVTDSLPAPTPWRHRRTSGTAIISGLEIDFSEPLLPDRNFQLPNPPPPPPPTSQPIVSDRMVHRLPPPSLPPPPSDHTSHRLPLPPMINPSSATTRIIHTSHRLPPPPPPVRRELSWDPFFPSVEHVPGPVPVPEPKLILRESTMGASTVMEDVEAKTVMEDVTAKKITEEMLVGNSDCSTLCAVCLEDFEVNQLVGQMPCKHMYHSQCILPWLASHHTCPVCRYRLN